MKTILTLLICFVTVFAKGQVKLSDLPRLTTLSDTTTVMTVTAEVYPEGFKPVHLPTTRGIFLNNMLSNRTLYGTTVAGNLVIAGGVLTNALLSIITQSGTNALSVTSNGVVQFGRSDSAGGPWTLDARNPSLFRFYGLGIGVDQMQLQEEGPLVRFPGGVTVSNFFEVLNQNGNRILDINADGYVAHPSVTVRGVPGAATNSFQVLGTNWAAAVFVDSNNVFSARSNAALGTVQTHPAVFVEGYADLYGRIRMYDGANNVTSEVLSLQDATLILNTNVQISATASVMPLAPGVGSIGTTLYPWSNAVFKFATVYPRLGVATNSFQVLGTNGEPAVTVSSNGVLNVKTNLQVAGATALDSANDGSLYIGTDVAYAGRRDDTVLGSLRTTTTGYPIMQHLIRYTTGELGLSGPTNYFLRADSSPIFLGKTNCNFLSWTYGNYANDETYFVPFTVIVTNLSPVNHTISFDSTSTRWRFWSSMYGTNAPSIVTNGTQLTMHGEAINTNVTITFNYFAPAY